MCVLSFSCSKSGRKLSNHVNLQIKSHYIRAIKWGTPCEQNCQRWSEAASEIWQEELLQYIERSHTEWLSVCRLQIVTLVQGQIELKILYSGTSQSKHKEPLSSASVLWGEQGWIIQIWVHHAKARVLQKRSACDGISPTVNITRNGLFWIY